MFSDHLRKIDNVSNNKLFLVASLLVVVCQLIAMAMVASGQVEKAQLRDSRLAVARTELANCIETSVGAGRHGCVMQARSTYEPVNSVLTDVVSVGAGEYGNAEGRSLSQMVRHQASLAGTPAGGSGVMAVAFGAP